MHRTLVRDLRPARRLWLILGLALLASCAKQESVEVTDTREPIGVQYAAVPELQVHKWAKDDSPVIATYLSGESVSIMSKRGDWAEVRTAGATGFVHAAELSDAATAQKEKENPEPKFRNIPSPVTAPGAKGTVYIEAQVNTEGEITSTKIIENTTGRPELASRNAEALERARFYPIVIKGDRKPFVYYYRVDY